MRECESVGCPQVLQRMRTHHNEVDVPIEEAGAARDADNAGDVRLEWRARRVLLQHSARRELHVPVEAPLLRGLKLLRVERREFARVGHQRHDSLI